MTTPAEAIETEALSLPREDRTRLVMHLLESIEERPDAVEVKGRADGLGDPPGKRLIRQLGEHLSRLVENPERQPPWAFRRLSC